MSILLGLAIVATIFASAWIGGRIADLFYGGMRWLARR